MEMIEILAISIILYIFLYLNTLLIISAQNVLAVSASGRLITNILGESLLSFMISLTSCVEL